MTRVIEPREGGLLLRPRVPRRRGELEAVDLERRQLLCYRDVVERHLAPAVESLRGGAWEKTRFAGRELAGRTLGVAGFGRLGGVGSG